MGIIPERTKQTLKEDFEKNLRESVSLLVFTQENECPSCSQVRELAEEVATLSDKIKVEVYDFTKDGGVAKKY